MERIVGRGPAGRSDVPYRHRELKATADIAGRYRCGESAEEVAHDLGVSVTLVFAELKRQRVPLRGRTDPFTPSYVDVLTEKFLREAYVNDRRDVWDIAAELGCSESTVRNWMRRHGIPPRPTGERRRAYKYPPELLDRVAAGDTSVIDAAVELGCSRTELERALRRSGRTLPRHRRPALTREFLVREYLDRSKSCPQIAAETRWSTQTIRARLREFGIERRRGPAGPR